MFLRGTVLQRHKLCILRTDHFCLLRPGVQGKGYVATRPTCGPPLILSVHFEALRTPQAVAVVSLPGPFVGHL